MHPMIDYLLARALRVAVILTGLSATRLGATTGLDDMMLQVDDVVDGQVVGQYVNDWWQWAYSMPPVSSPVRDLIGRNCHVGQRGKVWFLAGGFGSSTISRVCEVPAGRHLFFPVINVAFWPRSETVGYTCEQARSKAALSSDRLIDIYIALDGVPAWNPGSTRMSSPDCFDLLARVPREFEPPRIYPAASDGYWVMLKPLTPGEHTLTFRAIAGRQDDAVGEFMQDIEYTLTVK